MKPAAFDYHRPATLPEALALLARLGDEASVIAGGQSLVPMMNLRLARPAHLVDLQDLAATLRYVRESNDRIEIGALATHRDIERSPLAAAHCPILVAAAATIGHHAIRNRGTFGGSLAHADPAAQWPLLAVTLDAMVELEGPGGRRETPARGFFEGVMATARAPGELVVGARFPVLGPRTGWAFELFSRRKGDFALVAAAVTLEVDDAGRVRRGRLGLGGASPAPLALDEALAPLVGRVPDAAAVAAVAASVAQGLDPDDSPRVPAPYRRELAAVMVRRALERAAALPGRA